MKHFLLLIGSIILFSCNREKQIDLKLPTYENKIVVECYLEPGQPVRLFLAQSVSYFEVPTLPEINDAIVTVTHNGKIDTLKNSTHSLAGKRFNYFSTSNVPYDYNSEFILNINHHGQIVTGMTTILPPVSIDSTSLVYNSDSAAYLVTHFKDDPAVQNYYRYVVNKVLISNDTSITESLDFEFVDQITDGQILNKIREYQFKNIPGYKTELGVSLYQIDKPYYDFLQSIQDASDSNGNPFAQPTFIKSNVSGGLGIFTGLSADRKVTNLK